jgi:hypothetical protein
MHQYHNVHGITVPSGGLGFTRKTLPQLGPTEKFVENLSKHNVKHHEVTVQADRLKPSQSEFSFDNVAAIMKQKLHTKSSIVISRDGFVIDGHHRWLAHYNKHEKIKAVMVDMPALEIIQLAKTFNSTSYKELHDIVHRVVQEALKRR